MTKFGSVVVMKKLASGHGKETTSPFVREVYKILHEMPAQRSSLASAKVGNPSIVIEP